jgi:hypothetical protein
VSGRTHVNVGKETEQLVARYLRGRGLDGVERSVRTGFRTADRSVDDAGDLTGWPGVCLQVKSLRPATRAETQTRQWLAELESQRRQSGASVGLLVVRRWGTLDVGRWWCFLVARDLFGMADGHSATALRQLAPVRLELSDVVSMMQTWGWAPAQSDPLEENAQ